MYITFMVMCSEKTAHYLSGIFVFALGSELGQQWLKRSRSSQLCAELEQPKKGSTCFIAEWFKPGCMIDVMVVHKLVEVSTSTIITFSLASASHWFGTTKGKDWPTSYVEVFERYVRVICVWKWEEISGVRVKGT